MAVNFAVWEGVINYSGNGHIENLFDFESYIHDSFAFFVANVPFVSFFLSVLMGENDGGHGEGFAFEPYYVFVIIVLVCGLVSRKVESKEFFFAVDNRFSHRGQPVVMRVPGIKTLVVVDNAYRPFVRIIGFAVNGNRSRCLKKVLFAVKRIAEGAVLVFLEGHYAVCERRKTLERNIDFEFARFSFRIAFALRFSVKKIVDDGIFAFFGFAVAVVADKLFCNVRAFYGDEISPGINFLFGLFVPDEYGKTYGTYVIYRAYKRAFVHIYLESFPFGKTRALHKRGQADKTGFFAVEQIKIFKRRVESAEMGFTVLDNRAGRFCGIAFFADFGVVAHNILLLIIIPYNIRT